MAEPLEISVQGTPNPNAAKFTLNRVVAAQGTTYRPPAPPNGGAQAGDAAFSQPAWARELLGLAGVTQVFTVNNFISVTKMPEADWNVLAPQVEAVLQRAFV